MNTELKSAVMATDKDAQYDNSAKRLIAHKDYPGADPGEDRGGI